MKKAILILSLLSCFSLKNIAQISVGVPMGKAEKVVAESVEKLRKAMVDGDGATLTALAADDLNYGHSSGTIENKEEFVKAIASGKSDFVKIDISDQTIKVVGKTAIVRHKLMADTNNNGTAGTTKLSILYTWVKHKGTWKMLGRQAVKIP